MAKTCQVCGVKMERRGKTCSGSCRQKKWRDAHSGGWRPIASAPLDGTPVVVVGEILSPDVFYRGQRACISRYFARAQDSPAFVAGWYFQAPGFVSSFAPTHWMPLPS